VPILCLFSERQRKAANAVAIIRKTTEELIQKCKVMVENEQEYIESGNEEYINASDPSVLRFLLASRVEVSEAQLRDDLLSMLVAGHETTASVLTWTLKLLVDNPAAMAKAQAEADRVLAGRSAGQPVTMADTQALQYCMRCLNESMRLYPHPPVLIRRASEADTLPGGYAVPANQDIIISVYNIHHSPAVWDRAEEFLPERFALDEPIPNETNTDYKYIPFSGGPRKCVGDMFALLEAVTALAMVLHRFDFALVPNQDIGITTGATIHTLNGLFMTISERKSVAAVAR
jgi:carotene epsilon-monooxygenase